MMHLSLWDIKYVCEHKREPNTQTMLTAHSFSSEHKMLSNVMDWNEIIQWNIELFLPACLKGHTYGKITHT